MTNLDARYGRTRSSRVRTRIVVAIAAVAFAIVFTAWILWAGVLAPTAQLKAQDIGHTVVDDSTVEVNWRFTVEPGLAARCAVQALNSSFGVVGWRIVDVPASTSYTRDFTDLVRTSELAVTGLIYRCWLT